MRPTWLESGWIGPGNCAELVGRPIRRARRAGRSSGVRCCGLGSAGGTWQSGVPYVATTATTDPISRAVATLRGLARCGENQVQRRVSSQPLSFQ